MEGLKTLPLPRIAVFRHRIDESYLPLVQAVATDGSIPPESLDLPEGIVRLDLNDVDEIIAWIDKNAIRMKG